MSTITIEKVKEIIEETCGVNINDTQAKNLIDGWNEIFGFESTEQSDEVDNSRPHNPDSWTECEFCGLIHDPKLTRCHLS